MAIRSYIDERNAADPTRDTLEGITLGKVMDCKDPEQMGRLRILCTRFGDNPEKPTNTIPWARYASPFGGSISVLNRGPEDTMVDGKGIGGKAAIAYGMWAIPKPGAHVLTACIDGDPNQRVWFACIHDEALAHTMPHGRNILNQNGNESEGPLTAGEEQIEPTYSQMKAAFSGGSKNSQGDGRNSFEYFTRGADYSVAGIPGNLVFADDVPAELRDDFQAAPPNVGEFTTPGPEFRKVITQGYPPQRRVNGEESSSFDFESQTYSITTPGFHAWSMDDRPENCRIRIRTTKGQQIIFDDTNERIYLSTSQGKTWIELDEKGNMDIFAERRLSVHAQKDINFTTDETFRVTAKKGIHLETPDEYRLHTGKDIHVICDQNIRQVSKQETFLESLQDFNIYSDAQMLQFSKGNMHQKTASEYRATSSSSMHHRSGSTMFFTGGEIIHLNGPAARQADVADQCECELAFWTNRVPEHEPWSRAVMKDWEKNLSHSTLEFPYDSKDINKTDSDDDLKRGRFWRR